MGRYPSSAVEHLSCFLEPSLCLGFWRPLLSARSGNAGLEWIVELRRVFPATCSIVCCPILVEKAFHIFKVLPEPLAEQHVLAIKSFSLGFPFA